MMLGTTGSKGSSDKNRSRSTSPTQDHTANVRGIPAPMPSSGKQSGGGGGAFASVRTGSSGPGFPSPHLFGLPRPDGADRMLPREGSVGSAFASLTMSGDHGEPPAEDTKPQLKAASPPLDTRPKNEQQQRPKDATAGGGGPDESGAPATSSGGGGDGGGTPDPDRTGGATVPAGGADGNNGGSPLTNNNISSAAAGGAPGQSQGYNSNYNNGGSSSSSSGPQAAAAADNKFPRDSRIAPGVAAGEVFGGTGNVPQLPWVQCTGAGPNGKTICGALYSHHKVIKIVCKCHGNHMTPAEFVAHAGGVDVANPEKAITVSHFSLPNQAAIAHG